MPEDRWTWSIDECIPSKSAAGRPIVRQVIDQLRAQHWIDHDIYSVQLALEEALVNAIKHGNEYAPDKRVRVVCRVSPERIRIEIGDEGAGFDPQAVPDPTRDENLERPSGRGILLMKNFMTHVEYNEAGNVVAMEKVRSPIDEGDP